MAAVKVLRLLLLVIFLSLGERTSSLTTTDDDYKGMLPAGLPRRSTLSDEGDDRLFPAYSLCDPGRVSPDQLHCVEVTQAEELWVALANPLVLDIHILHSIEMDTAGFAASRGAINRTSSVRLLGAGPGVSLHLSPIVHTPEDGYWLELYAWLRVERFHTVTGLLSTLGLRHLSSTTFPLVDIVGVRVHEVEATEAMDEDFRIQGGYLTQHSGLLVMHSAVVANYGVGHVFVTSYTLKHWLRISRGVRRVMQLVPAWPVPAVMLRRGLLFTEGLMQEFRYVNVSLQFEGNWPSDANTEPALPLSRNENCQTLTDGIDGKDYVGNISVAHDGSACLPWASIQVPGVDFSGVEGNSCRNPADHFGAWCFTASPYPVDTASMYVNKDFDYDLDKLLRQVDGERFPYSWKYCDVPQCKANTFEDCQLQEDAGDSYVGTVSMSRNGKPCQLWNQSSVYDLGRPHSFCRNPSGYAQTSLRQGGVWCWTDVQRGEWELCDVRACTVGDFDNGSMSTLPSLDDDSEPEAEAAGDGFKNIMIGSMVAAVVLLQALAVIVYAVYRMRNSRRIIVYDLFEQPQFFGERPRDSATSVAPVPGYAIGVRQGAMAAGVEAPPLDSNWVLPYNTSFDNAMAPTLRDDSAVGDANFDDLPLPRKVASIINSSPAELGYVQLDSQLGVGTFGKVWKCKWTSEDGALLDAACKIVDMKGFQANLREQLGESVEAVYMKNRMIHQHVVRTMHVYKVLARQGGSSFGVGYSRPEEGMELWIIQELCGLGDLSAFSKASLESPRDGHYYQTVLDILLEVMSALTFLHEKGVVHADLKLDNILLQQDSNSAKGFVCKVGDFGVSHIMMGRNYYYSSSMSGEVRILAPEVLRSNKISTKMDTFSFGILMHDLYCPPVLGWQRDSFPVVCTKTLTGERPQFTVSTPQAYKDLAEACWRDDPEERPTDTHILSRLQSMLQHALDPASCTEATTSGT